MGILVNIHACTHDSKRLTVEPRNKWIAKRKIVSFKNCYDIAFIDSFWKNIFIYLAASGLSYFSLEVAQGLAFPAGKTSSIPVQGSTPHPLPCKADS